MKVPRVVQVLYKVLEMHKFGILLWYVIHYNQGVKRVFFDFGSLQFAEKVSVCRQVPPHLTSGSFDRGTRYQDWSSHGRKMYSLVQQNPTTPPVP